MTISDLNFSFDLILKCFQGEPVAVMHGANAPLLQRMIEREIRKERQVLKGDATREPIAMEDAVPG